MIIPRTIAVVSLLFVFLVGSPTLYYNNFSDILAETRCSGCGLGKHYFCLLGKDIVAFEHLFQVQVANDWRCSCGIYL